MSTVEILRAARERLSVPGVWAKGEDLGAARLCAATAVCRATAALDEVPAPSRALDALKKALGDDSIVEWNDDPDTTLADVLALYDRAIEAVRRTAREDVLAENARLRADLEAARLSDEEWDRQLAETDAESNISRLPPRLRSIDGGAA